MDDSIKIALVCDWLTGMRGGERCFEIACQLWPDADVFTLVHVPGSVSPAIETHKIHTSFIQRICPDAKHFRRYLPLFPFAIERFDLSKYDLVISFSHCVAKGVKVRPGTPHICYCHTPMRYAWDMRQSYLESLRVPYKWLTAAILEYLKWWDRKTASRVSEFIANSNYVRGRIKTAYNRDALVIYPPVDCGRFTVSNRDDGYYLIVSALAPYKRIDLAIEAFNSLGKKLVVIGNGHEKSSLERKAGKNIEFISNLSDSEVADYMQRCTALIFPGEEDFGIVPLEAQACGKPVIAFGSGGATETVIGLENTDRKRPTGVFFGKQDAESLMSAVRQFESNRNAFNPAVCRNNALRFDIPLFKNSLYQAVMRS
jgi:glycosyltransferase involved in cell wall biosynthesis